MLTKLSIKKPYTVVVLIIIVLIIGTVAVFSMPIDLLPNMDIPVMVVATVAPGQSPDQVESSVTAPLEGGLRQVNNVSKINSISSENVSIIIIQFSDKVDLTVATLDIQSQIKAVSPNFPSLTMEPIVMKIDPNMTPIMNLAISQEGKELTESSQYLQDIASKLKATEGVANVGTTGNVENMVALQLNMEHFASSIGRELISTIMGGAVNNPLPPGILDIIKALASGGAGGGLPPMDLGGMLGGLTGNLTRVINPKIIETALMASDFQMPAGQVTVGGVGYFVKVGNEVNTFEELADLPLLTLNVNSLIPNLSSPDGNTEELKKFLYYNDDGKLCLGEDAKSLLISVLPADQAERLLYGGTDADGKVFVGIINRDNTFVDGFDTWVKGIAPITARMNHIAQMHKLDNSSTQHALINGAPGIMLSIMKQPGFSTVDVSKGVLASLSSMQKSDSSLKYIVLFDQGNDINFMIETIVKNLLFGALFAILILLFFLKDIRPTITVGLSIVISVMGALGLMYLCGVTLNLVSMGGLALAVGMLVDNSIVVIENIYRKRREGMGAIKASYEGAKQVSGAIISSTLTTVIVFLPIIFVNGLVKQIFMDLALTIAFSLGASLLIALTLVPMLASRLLKKDPKPEYKFFEKVKTGYAKALDFSLNRKWITIVVVTVLFSVSILGVFFMNKELFPTVASDNFSIGVNVNREELDKQKDLTYNEALSDIIDGLYKTITKNENVENVGIELSSGTSYAGISLGGGQIVAYVDLKDKYKGKPDKIKANIEESLIGTEFFTAGICSTYNIDTLQVLGDVQALNITVKGTDLEKMKLATREISDLITEQNIGTLTNGLEKPPLEYRLDVDRELAAQYGLMPAQVFLALSEVLSAPGSNMNVKFDEDQNASKIFVYSFDYDLVMWYRTINTKTNEEVRVYSNTDVDAKFPYYIMGADNQKMAATEMNGSFYVKDPLTGIETGYAKKSQELFYEAVRKESLDLVTHLLRFGTILSNPDLSSMLTPEQKEVLNKGVPIYKFLENSSFEQGEYGQVIYREDDVNTPDIDERGIPKAVAMQEGFARINHDEGKRIFTIKVSVGANMTVNDAKIKINKILDSYTSPTGVTVEFKGEDELVTTIFNSLYLILGLAIVLIYLVMVAQFQSLKSPLIIMFTLPLAFTGSFLLLWMCGMGLSVFAIVGLIILVGLVVNNGIVYVDYANKLMLSGMSKREALLKTGQDRLRPILMTALTTIVALLASVFDFSPSAASMKPMAIATIGGLTYATLLTLFFVPIMYDLFNRKDKVKAIRFDDDKEVDIEAEMHKDRVMQLADVLPESAFTESESYIQSMNSLNSIEIVKNTAIVIDESIDRQLEKQQEKAFKRSKKEVIKPLNTESAIDKAGENLKAKEINRTPKEITKPNDKALYTKKEKKNKVLTKSVEVKVPVVEKSLKVDTSTKDIGNNADKAKIVDKHVRKGKKGGSKNDKFKD